MTMFERYVGVDYSGAQTPDARLAGLRVYVSDLGSRPVEIRVPGTRRLNWTRRGAAECVLELLRQPQPTLVGIDHGFSFPEAYFEKYGLKREWTSFLDDFCRHWPTDREGIWVRMVQRGEVGDGAARRGETRWRRLTDVRARAKSVFHFDVQGSVAKSTHAGLPWLRHLRQELGNAVHFWPFDGWRIPAGRSAIVEAYPSLWSREFPPEDRTPDQHDAYAIAAWTRQADVGGRLLRYFEPELSSTDRRRAEYEGWIFGVR